MSALSASVHRAKKVIKSLPHLPGRVKAALFLLLTEIESTSPVRGNWPNYSKLNPVRHHCHLKKGCPTYVAIWEVKDQKINLIEVIYAGTHKKPPTDKVALTFVAEVSHFFEWQANSRCPATLGEII